MSPARRLTYFDSPAECSEALNKFLNEQRIKRGLAFAAERLGSFPGALCLGAFVVVGLVVLAAEVAEVEAELEG